MLSVPDSQADDLLKALFDAGVQTAARIGTVEKGATEIIVV